MLFEKTTHHDAWLRQKKTFYTKKSTKWYKKHDTRNNPSDGIKDMLQETIHQMV